MMVTPGFCDPLSSEALSSGSRLPSFGGFPEAHAASVSAASAGLRRRWTELKHQLQLWILRTDKKNGHAENKSSMNEDCKHKKCDSTNTKIYGPEFTSPDCTWLSVLC